MAVRSLLLLAALHYLLGGQLAAAIELDPTSADSVKDAASTIVYGMMKYYTGNETGDTPGNLPDPYYWWEAGGMFGQMVDYYYYTNVTSYNEATVQAIVHQAGDAGDFMPANQTKTEGNDDQVFWAFTAMDAAELNFVSPDSGPTNDDSHSWVSMGQAVFNEQTTRWDNSTCSGGLRWQIFTWNSGYDYKNVASNGGFFQLAARLARYTNNETYADWAKTEWEWFSNSILYDNETHKIYDGTSDTDNCTEADHTQWTYNYGIWLNGLAYMYNHTEDDIWLQHLNGILNQTISTFFPSEYDDIMVEVACEPYGTCTTDQFTFKGFTMRWLAVVAQLVPSTASTIWPLIRASAKGAAGQCDGGTDGVTCGMTWNTTTWDGSYGVGQQMSALAAVQANMITIDDLKPPYTTDTGGTSKGNPSAGTGSDSGGGAGGGSGGASSRVYTDPITSGDKAGAGILTALMLLFTLGGAAWMVIF
ncbi:glycoside hydrolase family 76 protein [Hortaea werneckii]|nr:glycoside hydrolase family 76 protein [Hortaea werneckii]